MHVRFRVLLLALIAAAAFVAGATASTSSSAGAAANYIVLYKGQAVPKDAASTISKAGGSLVYSYDQIGVAIARSSDASFRDNLLKDNRIDNASTTAGFATQLPNEQVEAGGGPDGALPNSPATEDPLFNLQWDMAQIHTPEAHAITGGSPSVLVGDIDTGLDYTHPDLAANVSDANSVNCESGVPVQGKVAANDDNGHGTHTAGTIAAASNGIGIVGVAPNVKIAGIKAGNAAGFFFPEAVICSFVWAATHHFDVTNNSYFADPYLFNCRNDSTQRAIWKAESRAIQYAESNGVAVVAAMGNESEDLAHPTHDATSPDTDPERRCRRDAGCGAGRRFGLSQSRGYSRAGQRKGPLDVPGEPAVLAQGDGRRRGVLLSARDVNGVAARRRRRCADHQRVRPHGAGEGEGVPDPDGRSTTVPDGVARELRGILRRRHADREVLSVPGWPGEQLLVRERASGRVQRGHPLRHT